MYIPSTSIMHITEPAKLSPIEVSIIASGEIKAFQLVTVGAQVSGQIQRLHVVRGQKVAKGDLIAEIDSTTQENELNIQLALLQNYEAKLKARQVTLKIAQKQYDREKLLHRRNATSNENIENIESTLANAKADVAEMQSLVTQTQISVKTAEANLGYTKITAPIDGTVISIPVEEGQTINAAQVTPTIVQLADLSTMNLDILISEADVTKIAPGLDVTFTILSDPQRSYSTKLLSIDPADSISTTSTTNDSSYGQAENAIYYYGRARVDNGDGRLRIKMTAQCSILIASKKEALVVSSTSIITNGRKSTVQILSKDGVVEERIVELGLSDGVVTEISSGLSEGENVIVTSISDNEITQSINKFAN